ncbi:hypothetical protein [Enterococcus gallinarum]|uniref:hypothetical protein n=1 Tax=Enterococcus gallinarum TaxID=1353 RepID=UPI0032E4ED2C
MSKDISIATGRQVKFLDETIQKLESFRQSVSSGEVTMGDAIFQDEHTAPTIDEAGGRNVYMRIDYHLTDEIAESEE